MENQHRQITGYRELQQHEIDLMNEIKAHGAVLQALVDEVRARLVVQETALQASGAEKERFKQAEPQRWVALARTHFQEGLMALTRAIAQPTSF